MLSGVGHKKQPPKMSIAGGRNPPIDKGGEIVGGGGNWIIPFRIRLLCAFAHISWRDCRNFHGRSNGPAAHVDPESPDSNLDGRC